MVSILLCTRNRAESLDLTLQSLRQVEVPPGTRVELVLVDNGSEDATPAVVERHREGFAFPVRFVMEPHKGKSRALNAGVLAAEGQVLLFTDDDLRFPTRWIAGMTTAILEGETDVVQGGIRWSPELLGRLPPKSFLPRMLASTPHKAGSELATALIGANMAIRREAVLQAGLFDVELGPGALGLGEETLLAYQLTRLGYRKSLALDVEVEHHFDPTRLTPEGIAAMAASKGRSLGYIDYHWRHQPPPATRWPERLLKLKLALRRLAQPKRKNPHGWPAEWEVSYLSSIARFQQLAIEARRERKYQEGPGKGRGQEETLKC